MADTQRPAKTVLVVEDDFSTREGLAASLKRRGFDVATARNGAVAVALLASWVVPDLVILDPLVPYGPGFLEEFRRSRHRSVPVIVTGGADSSPAWALGHGCALLLHKPIDEDQLIAAIGGVLGGR
jgi:DNA-binding response OmpR family regulator